MRQRTRQYKLNTTVIAALLKITKNYV